MTNEERLRRIAFIIEAVDNRCMAVDGPVTPTLQEMTQSEISEIYKLASQPTTPADGEETLTESITQPDIKFCETCGTPLGFH